MSNGSETWAAPRVFGRGGRETEGAGARPVAARHAVVMLRLDDEMSHAPACKVCGYPVFDAKNHDIPAPRAAKMFPLMTCQCGIPARVSLAILN